MSAEQAELFAPSGAICGYCGTVLTRGSWPGFRCEPCQPGLAAIKGDTFDELVVSWGAFVRARRRATRGTP